MTKNNFGIGERELLYKVWHKKYKGFLDIDLRISLTDGNGIEAEYDLNDVVFCQYTGLKDKNGKKIFEGYVLRGTYQEDARIDVVEYVNHGFFPFAEQTDYNGITYYDEFTYEIVGNVFENPELTPEK